MARQVTMGELMEYAETRGIPFDEDEVSYEDMREKVDVLECKQCGTEYLTGWTDEFCSDACETEYINENFR